MCVVKMLIVRFGMDAVATPYLTEHLVSWLLLLFSLPFMFYVLYMTPDTNYDTEAVYHVEDVSDEKMHGAAMPKGHHTDHNGAPVVETKDAYGTDETKV